MKRLITVLLLILILISAVGCDLPFFGESDTPDPGKITEADSVSTFNIYPETLHFKPIEKFERVGFGELNKTQKGIYILLDNAIFNMQTGYISLGTVSQNDIRKAYFALKLDRPEYFWIPSTYSLRSNGNKNEICLAKSSSDWLYTTSERKNLEAEIFKFLTNFDQGLTGDETQYSRELVAHDTLNELIEYDYENVDNYSNNPAAWDITGAICRGKAVCEGYSKAMQVLSYALGINCSTVTGIATGPHMWNVICIDNSWYHLDLTANDSQNNGYRFYFNVTTEYILKSRTVDADFDTVETANINDRSNIFLPKCTATEQNYHVLESTYIAEKKQVESTLVSIICAARRQGKRSVEFAVSPEMGFVFGNTDTAKFFNIEKCISIANSELGSKRIKKFNYGGVNGALGFVISW